MAEATHLLGLPLKHKPKDINPAGGFPYSIIPSVDNAYDLGAISPLKAWRYILGHTLYAHDDGGLSIGITDPTFGIGGDDKRITWSRATGSWPFFQYHIWRIIADCFDDALAIDFGGGEGPIYSTILKLIASGPKIQLNGETIIYTYPDYWILRPKYPDRDLLFIHKDYSSGVETEIFRLKSGLASPTPIMEVSKDIVPASTDTVKLGSSSKRFLEAHIKEIKNLVTCPIKTSDDEVYGLIRTGLDANKPAAGVSGRFYWATDTKILYYDNGTTWIETARGETVTRLAQLSEKSHSSLMGIGPSDHHVWQQRLALVKMVGHASKSGTGWAVISYSDVVFDPNWLTGTVKGRLCIVARMTGAGTGYARLYQQFQGLYMASTQIDVTGTGWAIYRSPEFSDWYNGLESYQLALYGVSGVSIEVASAVVEIWVS